MSNIWTLEDGCRAAHSADGSLVEPRKAHSRYVVATPTGIKARLESHGYDVVEAYGRKGRLLSSPRTAILSIRTKSRRDMPEGYTGQVNCYLDHRGRSSILFTAGALRHECANCFTSPMLRLHHCSDGALKFVHEPWRAIERLLSLANAPINRLESTRDLPGGSGLLRHVLEKAPRLASKALEAHRGTYVPVNGPDGLWGALQALTEPSVRRLDEFVGRLLGHDDILVSDPAVRALHVASCWN